MRAHSLLSSDGPPTMVNDRKEERAMTRSSYKQKAESLRNWIGPTAQIISAIVLLARTLIR
jgi:hypothetical protein